MKGITRRQLGILQFIESFLEEKGYPPTIRETGEAFSITAKGAFDHIRALEKKGFIRIQKNLSRAIEVLKPSHELLSPQSPPPAPKNSIPEFIQVPVLGKIAAGNPILAEEYIEDYISIPRPKQSTGDIYAVKVSGSSMKDCGILDGDIAILHKQNIAENGDIVAALIDDEATLKYFYKDKQKIRLVAANDAFPDIFLENVLILGKLIQISRSIH